MTKEMEKLRELLDAEHITWNDASREGEMCPMCRTHFRYRGYKWSVIHGYGSYGGYSIITADEGLLELMSEAVNGGDPVGWLTANQVMEYVKGTNHESNDND